MFQHDQNSLSVSLFLLLSFVSNSMYNSSTPVFLIHPSSEPSILNFSIMEKKSRALEFTVLSTEELRVDNRYLKKNALAVVSIDPHNLPMTEVDSEGGRYPAWNQKFVMDFPSQQRFITLEVKCRTSSGEKSIGSVKVPVSEFIGGYTPENCFQFSSYRLLDARGHQNGIINFFVRVKGPEKACSSQAAGIGKIPIDGMRNFGGIFTGIPIWSVTG